MRMRLRMLKHCVGKGRHVMKQLHTGICHGVLQYYAIVATERAGYVLYRALVPIRKYPSLFYGANINTLIRKTC